MRSLATRFLQRPRLWPLLLALSMTACQQQPAVLDVRIDPAAPSVTWGESLQLSVDVTTVGGAIKTVVWSSNAPATVSIDAGGTITGEQVGTATVTATSIADPTKSDAVVVTVEPIAEEIVFWHIFGDEARGGWIDDRAAEFNASLAARGLDTRVVAVRKGSYEQALDEVLVPAGDGAPPHLVTVYEAGTQRALDADVFVSVQDLGGVDPGRYLAPVAAYYTVGGQLRSIPFNSSVPLLFANSDLLSAAGLDPDALPATYAEFLAACAAIELAGLGVDCVAFPLTSWLLEQWLAEQGAFLVDQENGRAGRATEVLLTSPEALAVAGFFADLADGGWDRYGASFQDAVAPFLDEQVAFLITSSADVGQITAAAADRGFGLTSGALPVPGGEGLGVVVGGASIWLTKDHPRKELEIARDFALYLTDDANSADWHKLTGYVPVATASVDLLENEGRFEANPHHATAFGRLLATVPGPATAGALFGSFPETRSIVADALRSILEGQVDAEAAMNQAKILADQALLAYEAAR